LPLLTLSQAEGLLFWAWLGGYKYEGGEIKSGRLLTIEELGELLKSTWLASTTRRCC
jgi:hypothetical protein